MMAWSRMLNLVELATEDASQKRTVSLFKFKPKWPTSGWFYNAPNSRPIRRHSQRPNEAQNVRILYRCWWGESTWEAWDVTRWRRQISRLTAKQNTVSEFLRVSQAIEGAEPGMIARFFQKRMRFLLSKYQWPRRRRGWKKKLGYGKH